MNFRIACLALGLFITGGATSFASGSVAPSAEQIAIFEAADQGTRVKILLLLARNGNHGIARSLLETYPLEGPFAANRSVFIEGLILKAEGDLTGAVSKFRDALADDPKLTLVRSELAKTLVALEQHDSAKHHLELLAADAPDQDSASGVRSFIDRIDDRRPYSFDLYVSLAPSSNLNNGTSTKKVYVPGSSIPWEPGPDLKPTKGIGVATGLNASYNKRLGNDFRFIAAGGADVSIYSDKDFNSYSLSQSLELRYIFERGYLGIGAVGSQALDNSKIDISNLAYGPRVAGRFELTTRDSINTSTIFEWNDRLADGSIESTNWVNDISITHAFDSSFNMTLSAGYDKVTVDGNDSVSYGTWSAGLGTYKELPFGVSVNARGEYRKSEFDDENITFQKIRSDHRFVGNLSLTKRDFNIFGFAPQLTYSYSYNASNIDFYDFNTHAIDFKLTKEF